MDKRRAVSRAVVLNLFRGAYRFSGDEINYKVCPRCKRDKWRFYVNPSKGIGWCHNCQYKPNLMKMAGDAGSYIDLDPEDYYTEESKDPEPLPADATHVSGMSFLHPIFGFLRQRRFTIEALERYNVMYCGKGVMRNRLLFPFYGLDGEYLGFQGRYIYGLEKESKIPKWRQGAHCQKRKILYNYGRVFGQQDWCVLSEGIFDCLRQPDWAVAMFGKVPSMEQREKLEYFKYIYIMLDDDASAQALKLSRNLVSNAAFRVAPIILEKGDPDDHQVDELVEMIKAQAPNGWPTPTL